MAFSKVNSASLSNIYYIFIQANSFKRSQTTNTLIWLCITVNSMQRIWIHPPSTFMTAAHGIKCSQSAHHAVQINIPKMNIGIKSV